MFAHNSSDQVFHYMFMQSGIILLSLLNILIPSMHVCDFTAHSITSILLAPASRTIARETYDEKNKIITVKKTNRKRKYTLWQINGFIWKFQGCSEISVIGILLLSWWFCLQINQPEDASVCVRTIIYLLLFIYFALCTLLEICLALSVSSMSAHIIFVVHSLMETPFDLLPRSWDFQSGERT